MLSKFYRALPGTDGGPKQRDRFDVLRHPVRLSCSPRDGALSTVQSSSLNGLGARERFQKKDIDQSHSSGKAGHG